MTVTDIRRTRVRAPRQPDDVTPADPRVAEVHAALNDERFRAYWPELQAELVKLTATGMLAA